MKLFKSIIIIFLIISCCLYCAASVCAATDGSDYGFFDYVEKYDDYVNDKNGEKMTVEEFFGIEESSSDKVSDERDYLAEYFEAIPEDVRNELPSGADGDFSFDSYDFSYFSDKLKKAALNLFPSYKSSMLSILAILLVSGVCTKFSENTRIGIRHAFSIVSCTALGVCIFNTGIFELGNIRSFINSVSQVSTTLIPTLTALLAATGNLSSAVLAAENLTVVCTVTELVFSKIVYPLVSVSAAVSLVGAALNFDEGLAVSGLFRKAATFITVFTMSFLVFVIAVQTKLSSAADSIGIKTVKFAVGNFIPFVGGAVSETLNTVGAGLGYVKNTCGSVSLVVLFILVLPPLLSLFFGKMMFYVSSSVADMLGCKIEAKLFTELFAISDSLIALVVSASVVFVYILLFVINCGVKFGGG